MTKRLTIKQSTSEGKNTYSVVIETKPDDEVFELCPYTCLLKVGEYVPEDKKEALAVISSLLPQFLDLYRTTIKLANEGMFKHGFDYEDSLCLDVIEQLSELKKFEKSFSEVSFDDAIA